ncbi:MAG: rod shape-determining protein [Lachnospiraceae bacterium]|nr:rod shape-determining protein [Lachnospiraceae bacterium]MBQ4242816.1 rod shape-determining protein [Lachnospiraceae bacterium]MCR4786529.1 rod shape-determining protein [Lachnospiraceae bacterium]
MSNMAFGIDLGTGNIKIYYSGKDTITNEKNMIAIMKKDTLFAYGDAAFDMFEKAPRNIKVSYPLVNGVIADIGHMTIVLREFVNELTDGRGAGADFYMSVPTDVTEVEKRAFYDLIKDSGMKPRKIMMVEKSLADGLGMGIDVKTSQGVLVVDIGYETTEISVLSLGGIVLSKLIKTGGRKFDDAIRSIIRKEFGLVIGEKTAEQVKISLQSIENAGEPATVFGRDLVTGLPVERAVPTDLIDNTVAETASAIIDNIKLILERTPPELSADIYRHGIYLTGGTASLAHLDELIVKGTALKVNRSESPQECAAMGLARVIKDHNFRSIAYSIAEMSEDV